MIAMNVETKGSGQFPSSVVVASARRQSGQVMPMTAVLIVAVLLALWTMFDSGQVMTEKIKLQNTADNVAYSSSALVARDLNFSAYTTRAMVANQVAIGQMVGVSSWATMMERLGQSLGVFGKVAGFVPVVGTAITAITQAIQNATSFLSTAVDTVTKTVIPFNDAVNLALSKSQFLHRSATIAALPNFTKSVMAANDPEAELLTDGLGETAQAVVEWADDIGRYAGNDARVIDAFSSDEDIAATARVNEFANVTNASRDVFSSERSYEMGFPLSGDIFLGSWETRKRGGSDFKATPKVDGSYDWDWSAMDTVSLDVRFEIGSGIFSTCVLCFDVPLGWGGAHALEKSGSYYDYESGDDWGGAWDNDNAAELAAGLNSHDNLSNTNGIPEFYAFRDESRSHMSGPSMVLLFRKSVDAISLTEDLGATGDNPLNTGTAGGWLAAAAKGQPYYARPTDVQQFARRDGNVEYGNLYNPFWQPRLGKLSDAEKSAVAAISGVF
ncbi:TadE/TadG family type IV pilus assembly protein [Halomonas sp. LS-001]